MAAVKDRIRHYKEVIRRTPFKLLVSMLFSKIRDKIKDIYLYRRVKRGGAGLTDLEFLKELGQRTRPGVSGYDLLDRFIDFEFLQSIFNDEDKVYVLSSLSEKEKMEIIGSADNICGHYFDVLGSGKTRLLYSIDPAGLEGNKYSHRIEETEYRQIKEKIKARVKQLFPGIEGPKDIDYEPIDWQMDLKSGYRWDQSVWYKNISYGSTAGADIKVPWEISRCQHFLVLGQAYALTGDKKYAREYTYQLVDWIENNDIQFGANWRCTMDVAIRAANWVISLPYFTGSAYITEQFQFYLFKNVFCHGKHIMANLEFSSITSNHYLSDISGLFFISMLFAKNNTGKKWLSFSVSELAKEMDKQVYDDGVDFEASTCYHRLVLELFFYPVLYYSKMDGASGGRELRDSGEKYFGKDFIRKLYGMFDFVLNSLKPDGTVPQIGDNDNGRLFIFSEREVLDQRYLAAFAAVFFEDTRFKIGEFGFPGEAVWVFGRDARAMWDNLESNSITDMGSSAYRDSGLYIMRKGKDYLISSCGPNGQSGNGGHAHNDKLGFELVSSGRNIIVDPGTYIYTPVPEWRNRFRSTASHNTIRVDGQEQNRFKDDDLFSLHNDAVVSVNKWLSNPEFDFLDAIHRGYARSADPVMHRRQILFEKKESLWLIRDILQANEKHRYDLYFHISDELAVEANSSSLLSSVLDGDKDIFYITPLLTEGLELKTEEGFYSQGYGDKETSMVLKYSKDVTGGTEFIFLLSGDLQKKDTDIYLDRIKYISDNK